MYPIPASRGLSLVEIADHWSREIKPSRTKDELIIDLGKAWWGGEFQSTKGTTRLDAIKRLFELEPSQSPFWMLGEDWPKPETEHLSSSTAFLLRTILRLPSSDAETWTDTACVAAYKKIAEDWGTGLFNLVEPMVNSVSLSEAAFSTWIIELGYTRPGFWGKSEGVADHEGRPFIMSAGQKPPLTIVARKRGPAPVVLTRVKSAMRADIQSGKFSIEQLMLVTEESLRAEYAASRDIIRRARIEIQSEFVGD